MTYSVSGDDTQTALQYGVVEGPFGPFPIAGGDLSITITDNTDAACQLIDIAVNAPQTCSDVCELDEPVILTSCDDNGTPNDPADDTYTYTIQVTGSNTGGTYDISGDDTQTGLAYNVVNGPFGPFPISGGDLSITVEDSDDANCTNDVIVEAPASCSDQCILDPPVIQTLCDDNGTPTDPSDDTFTFTISVSGQNVGFAYHLSGDVTMNNLFYDVVEGPFGPFPIAGGDLSITITDAQDANCQLIDIAVNAPQTCSDLCELNEPIIITFCDDNGTPANPSDDTFIYFIEVTGANVGATYDITGDDTQTGLAYGVQNGPFGPFPISGGDLDITISDVDDAGCNLSTEVDAPNTCSDVCLLDSPIINTVCDDNGTPSDPSDDTFTYTIFVTGSNTGFAYHISGDDNQNNLFYGVLEGPFGPFPIAGGDLSITITDAMDSDCELIDIAVNAPQPCSDVCDLDEPVILTFCDDNGTPSNPNDDTFSYTIQVTGSNTGGAYNVTGDDTQAGLAYNVVNGPFGPFPISGGDLNITVTDVNDAACSEVVLVEATEPCSGVCNLDPPLIVATCDDNGTPTDPSDDTFTYTIQVTGTNTGGTYTITGDDAQSNLTYGVVEGPFGPFPIAGGDLSINITDSDDAQCQLIDIAVNAPQTCSDVCVIQQANYTVFCDDNGTPTDSLDDVFFYTLEVTGVNTAGTYNVTGDDNQFGQLYNVVNGPFGPFPIAGGDLNITVEDAADPGCTLAVQIEAPNACSNTCSISAAILNIKCEDNGTPFDPTDDVYTYEIFVTGSNNGATYSISGDDVHTGLAYNVTNGPFGPFPIAGGDLELFISDDDNPSCQTIETVDAPLPCSFDCDIDDITAVTSCDNNGTPSDPSDDTFTYQLFVTGSQTATTYNVSGDDTQTGLSYGVFEGPYGPFPISGGNLDLVITDADDPECTATVEVIAPAPCSNACDINTPAISAICNDNGTPNDPSDDTYTYTVFATASNGSASFNISGDDTQFGLAYGVVNGPFGPFPIIDGNLDITISDAVVPNCTIDATVTAPQTCSDGCQLNDPLIEVNCSDNGTPNNPTDDTYTFTVTLTGYGVGTSYQINGEYFATGLLYDVPNGPFGPFLISQGDLSITLIDIDDPECTIDATVTAPTNCSNDCGIFPPAIGVICDDNGTPSDPTDDVFFYQIFVNGSNTSGTYNITGADTQFGLAYNVVNGPFGPFPIADGIQLINITDGGNPSCNLPNQPIVPPSSCSFDCALNDPLVNTICDDNGTPDDPSDDTYSYTILVDGNATGDSYNIFGDDTQIGLEYGVVNGPFGPFPLNAGDLNITIVDEDDSACQIDEVINTPTSCVPSNANIGNFVWEDLDGDGIQDMGEPGIEGVNVTLTGTDVFGNSVSLTTTTDINGLYGFTNLTPGIYKLTFETPSGFTPTILNAGTNDALDSDADPLMGGMTNFEVLSSGETNLDYDAGYYQLASIGDFVWEDMNGNGIQEAGEDGIEGVQVVITGFDNQGNFFTDVTFTDADGFYLFDNLVPGNYEITFFPDGDYVLTGQDQGGNDALDSDANPATGMTITEQLASGENNLTYDAGVYLPATIGNFVWVDEDEDGIQDANEPGLEGVTVTLTGFDGQGNPIVLSTTTDADGGYEFTDLPPGIYKLTFETPAGYNLTVANAGTDDELDSDADASMDGMTEFEILFSGEENLTYDAGYIQDVTGSIGDFVWEDLDGDGLQDDNEPGIGGVQVTLTGTDDNGNPIFQVTFTDADGFYIFNNLQPGTYKLTFTTPLGYVSTTPNVGTDDSVDSDADPTMGGMTDFEVLSPGENNTDYDAGYYQLGSISDYTWIDNNSDGIQDPDEDPFEGVTVYLYNCDDLNNPIDSTVTDANGFYIFDNLVPGEYALQFSDFDGVFAFTNLNATPNDELDSDVNPDTGFTDCVLIESGEDDSSVDAGYVPCSPAGDFECIEELLITLDDNCEAEIDPSTLIPGEAACYLHLVLEIVDGDGNVVVDNIITGDYLGDTLFATITDTFSLNMCTTVLIIDAPENPALECPEDVNISCVNWAEGLGAWLFVGEFDVLDEYGTVSSEDGTCVGDVEYDVTWDVDMCMAGEIIRTWSVLDDDGNVVTSCSQIITLDHVSDFVVTFPEDTIAECTQLPIDITGEPQIFFEECELVATSYEDWYLEAVDDACFKIVRTWWVINWCLFEEYGFDAFQELTEAEAGVDFDGDGDMDDYTYMDGVNPEGINDGWIEHTQIIKVIDLEAPVFDVDDQVACIDFATGTATVELPEPDVEDCSIEIFVDIITDLPNGSGYGPYTDVPPGEYYALYNVLDNCGNVAGDLVTIIVGECDDKLVLSGRIRREDQALVNGVWLNVNDGEFITQTVVEGFYMFDDLDHGTDYECVPSKNDDPANGVTTLDLVFIKGHVLGIQPLETPYQMIAADANNSGSVTTLDMVIIQKMILGVQSEWPNNTSWRFVDSDYVFPDPTNPWLEPFPESIIRNNMVEDDWLGDFVAIKIGDINLSANLNLNEEPEDRSSTGTLYLRTYDRDLRSGESYDIEIHPDDLEIYGQQFTLLLDQDAIELIEIVPGIMDASNFGMTYLEEGLITGSWSEADLQQLRAEEVLFTLRIQAYETVRLSEVLSMNSLITKAEAYGRHYEQYALDLMIDAAALTVEQNIPNPFRDETVIPFFLPEDGTVNCIVTDAFGKEVLRVEQDFQAGNNRLLLENMKGAGVFYYTITNGTESVTRKMIKVY
jgi:protocatechuate 3,4-dioxygenase beta subunit